MKKKIVVMGGGNGSAITLNAVKKFVDNFEISAVISVSDSGGSSGRLRQEFDTLPPGDILRAVLALSPYDYPILKKIFHINRFSDNIKLAGHNLGNLFMTLIKNYTGNFIDSIRTLEQAVEAVGQVYPATLNKTDLVAELSDNSLIKGEAKIDIPEYNKNLRIKKVWLEPEAQIYSEAKRVIEEADYIFFGPGSLYTSVIASFLPNGFQEAFKNSQAKFIYIAGNARQKNGETGPRVWSEFVKTLENYLPRPLDFIIRNSHQFNEMEKKKYEERCWEETPFDPENLPNRKIILGDYERFGGGLCPDKLREIIKKEILK
ncbi:MAG: gluconeogenesis factor YvcK family protein [Patescibacteria group bacterium]|jgi:uncharacterized cofD-like protein